MNEFEKVIDTKNSDIDLEQRTFMTKVYGWMTLALLTTAVVSMYVSNSPRLLSFVFGNMFLFFGLIITEFILVGYLVRRAMSMSLNRAVLTFFTYSILNGITLSILLLAYTKESIAATFFMTAGVFGVMSAYGFLTKKDLTSVGSFMHMGLWGIIIASLVNIFLRSNVMHWMISFIGVIVFVGLTAYDTQKIKNMNIIGNAGTDEDKKEAIVGALILYLDFINLFIMLLRLFGSRRSNW